MSLLAILLYIFFRLAKMLPNSDATKNKLKKKTYENSRPVVSITAYVEQSFIVINYTSSPVPDHRRWLV